MARVKMSAGQPSNFTQITKPPRRRPAAGGESAVPPAIAVAAGAGESAAPPAVAAGAGESPGAGSPPGPLGAPGGGRGNTPRPGAPVPSAEEAEIHRLLSSFDYAEAIRNRDVERLQGLRAYGVDYNTPLIRGASHTLSPIEYVIKELDNPALIPMLVKLGVDLNAYSTLGETPINMSSATKSIPMLIALLDAGADPNKPKTLDGQARGITPIGSAVMGDNAEVVTIYLDRGVDPNQKVLNKGLLALAMSVNARNVFRVLAARPDINIEPFVECALNGGFPKYFTEILLERLGNPARISARGIPIAVTMYKTSTYMDKPDPEVGPDKLIQVLKGQEEWNDKTKDIIHTLIERECICARGVDDEYIRRKMDSGMIDFILLVKKIDPSELLAFALCKFIGPDGLYIDVICAKNKYKGFGPMLLDIIKGLQVFYKRPLLRLNSVPEKEEFYSGQKFIRQEARNKKGLKHMYFVHPTLVPPPPPRASAGVAGGAAAGAYSLPPPPPPAAASVAAGGAGAWVPGSLPPPPPYPPPGYQVGNKRPPPPGPPKPPLTAEQRATGPVGFAPVPGKATKPPRGERRGGKRTRRTHKQTRRTRR